MTKTLGNSALIKRDHRKLQPIAFPLAPTWTNDLKNQFGGSHLFEKELIPDILSFLTVTLGHFFFKNDLHLAPVFTNQTKFKEDFPLSQKMVESENTFSICFAAAFTEHQDHLSIRPHSFEMCLWAAVPYLNVLCVSIRKRCSKVSEKSKRACKGVMLKLKLDII